MSCSLFSYAYHTNLSLLVYQRSWWTLWRETSITLVGDVKTFSIYTLQCTPSASVCVRMTLNVLFRWRLVYEFLYWGVHKLITMASMNCAIIWNSANPIYDYNGNGCYLVCQYTLNLLGLKIPLTTLNHFDISESRHVRTINGDVLGLPARLIPNRRSNQWLMIIHTTSVNLLCQSNSW